MLRLEAFLDDNKAAKVLHALDGLVIQLTMAPVRNAVKKGKSIVGAGGPQTGTEVLANMMQETLQKGDNTFTTAALLEYAKTYGFNKTTVMAAVTALKKQKLLKGKGRGTYLITSKGAVDG